MSYYRWKLRKGLLILVAALVAGIFIQFSVDYRSVSEQDFIFKPSPPPFLKDSSAWADSVFQSLSANERIGQLFMVAAYPQRGNSDINRVTELIRKYHVGGIIFFQATPEQIAELTTYYQSISQVPLLFAMDGEWGLSMRFENTLQYPRQMMLGAIHDDDVIYQMGRDIGRQMKMLGLHINFAPVVDVNNNPDNPVINSRSFGEIRENVARKGLLYMKGMQDEGILAVAKHFPGHGDTDSDSHYELPVIKYSYERLDSIELFPFKALIEGGVGGVMTAHLNVLGIDTSRNLPSSLSAIITETLLKQKLNFKGLVFTDAMTMKGVAGLYDQEIANAMAVAAGNDIVLMPGEVEKTLMRVEQLIEQGDIDIDRINNSCRKILQAKKWVKTYESKEKVKNGSLQCDLIQPGFQVTQRKLIEKAITVIKNENNIIPLKRIDTLKIAAVNIGSEPENKYQNTLALYASLDSFRIYGTEGLSEVTSILDTLRYYNLVLLSIHGNDLRPGKQFGLSDELLTIADIIMYLHPTVLNVFSNPYLLSHLKNFDKSIAVIVSYENNNLIQNLSAQLVFGAIGAEGKLPVSINDKYRSGNGINTEGRIRLKYILPAEEGFDAEKLAVVDSLVEDAIDKKAMPGCQILVAKNGRVVMNKSYGYHTYLKRKKVESTDLYDLASITKIVAGVPSLMLLEHNRQIDIRSPLSKYLPELDTTNKAKIRIDDILLHQAGIESWIPFYISTLEPLYPNQNFAQNKYSKRYPIQMGKHFFVNKHLKYKDNCYSDEYSRQYPVEVAKGLYMNSSLVDSIFLTIYASEVEKPGKYHYSDLGFYLFYRMVERLTNKGFDSFVDSVFYAPLGATTLGYKPLQKFDRQYIAPTENDLVFRKQILQGYVHDPGAAMLGGVSGHAGLFSNANDLAKFMQMLLNGGEYGGQQFLDRKQIEEYTSCVACENGNRRGLGFDKPENDTTKNGPTFRGISPESYGHTGFTGTMVWADPETGILYIFLSNRVYPDAVYNKLAEMDVRTNIQKAIYDAMIGEGE